MGWTSWLPFTSSSYSPNQPRPSADGGFIAPDRHRRQQCYDARDAFFRCLDQFDILDSVKDADLTESHCAESLRGMERECAQSWVTYFKQRRVFEWRKAKQKEMLEKEGAEQLPEHIKLPLPKPRAS
ncbi:MAG: hypothetical protein LQ342_002163 [Letrouitia transgressa]|nr:MAG: hypothetical protein LQ342_002163 [Letrouitia transgressa]